jgi:hypothetical protein
MPSLSCGGKVNSDPDRSFRHLPEMYLTEVIKRLPYNATAEQAAELTLARFAAALRTDCPSHSQHATQARNLTRPKSPRALARLTVPKNQPQKK